MPSSNSQRIDSPCINVCELNAKNYCLGCRRSLDEIATWSSLSPEDRHRIMAELTKRKID